MHDMIEYKPPGTAWIKCNVFVSFDCDEKPSVDGDVKITGIKQFGFILSHEYEVEARVGDWRRVSCPSQPSFGEIGAYGNCENPIRYEYDVHFYVYEKIGLGFGLGAGTGTWGWTSRALEHAPRSVTRCVCCPEDRPKRALLEELMASGDKASSFFLVKGLLKEMRQARIASNRSGRSMTAAVIMLLAVFGTSAFFGTQGPSELAAPFMWSVGIGFGLSVMFAVHRFVGFRRAELDEGQGAPLAAKPRRIYTNLKLMRGGDESKSSTEDG